jgi:2-oxoglutarate ferredoxin oxidoreductase subunit delta
MAEPTIDYEKCTNCGVCIEICPMDVFAKKDEKVKVNNPKECIGCRACETQCPNSAIKVSE